MTASPRRSNPHVRHVPRARSHPGEPRTCGQTQTTDSTGGPCRTRSTVLARWIPLQAGPMKYLTRTLDKIPFSRIWARSRRILGASWFHGLLALLGLVLAAVAPML